MATSLGHWARGALLAEPCVWPRFGLVGPADSGSHTDMSYAKIEASAHHLAPFFATCASPDKGFASFEAFRAGGREAEEGMLRATGGVNTHKGAIFLLGLLLHAWADLRRRAPAVVPKVHQLFDQAHQLAAQSLLGDFSRRHRGFSETYGEWAWRRHGARGVRGLVIEGFLPLRLAAAEWQARPGFGSAAKALGRARLLFLALADDTNLIRRAGYAAAQDLKRQARRLLVDGTWRQVATLEAEMVKRRWSAAAAGDLTAAWFLLKEMRAHGLLG